MSKIEKLIAKLKQAQHGYLWGDLVIVLTKAYAIKQVRDVLKNEGLL